MLLSQESLTYRGHVEMNESAKLVKKFAGRKGGRRRVKKGFAKTLTSEKAREYVNKRWNKSNDTRADPEQEERKD